MKKKTTAGFTHFIKKDNRAAGDRRPDFLKLEAIRHHSDHQWPNKSYGQVPCVREKNKHNKNWSICIIHLCRHFKGDVKN